MKRIKLEDRIAGSYTLLFLTLMLIINISIFYFLKKQETIPLQKNFAKKQIEINDYLDRMDVFSDQVGDMSVDFIPQLDGQRVSYGKPFNPDEFNFNYIVRYTKENEVQIPLNTFGLIDSKVSQVENSNIIKELDKFNIKPDGTKGTVVNLSRLNGVYSVIRIKREIKGTEFDVYVLKNVNNESKLFDRLKFLLLFFTLIGIIIIIILSKKISKAILKPVNKVMQTAKNITMDDLSKRIEISNTGDELYKLTKIINQMLDRLEISFDNQTKFVSDASHELRTPLAIIKGYAEIIKRRRLTNEAVFDESVTAIINEVDNMKNLVQQLLFLAKGETNKINASFSSVDAEEFITHVYSDALVSEKKHTIHLEKAEKYTIDIDRSLLQQAIRQLLENAVKYSKEGTNVYIKSEIADEKGRISIRDEGVGIAEEDMLSVFERFYRVDESRAKMTGGTGLGLSIVKKIVELHKGQIEIYSELGVGTEIAVLIPLNLRNGSK